MNTMPEHIDRTRTAVAASRSLSHLPAGEVAQVTRVRVRNEQLGIGRADLLYPCHVPNAATALRQSVRKKDGRCKSSCRAGLVPYSRVVQGGDSASVRHESPPYK